MAPKIPLGLVEPVVVTVSSGLIVWYVRRMSNKWVDRADKLDEVYQAIFGMEDVGAMEGVVEVVEVHDKEIEENENKIEDLQEKMEDSEQRRDELNKRVEALQRKVEERGKSG